MRYFNLYLSLFLMLLTFSSCSKERETIIPQGSEVNEATVFKFNNESGVWRLFKNGEEWIAKGAATNRNYKRVAELGGNCIRTYSTSEESSPSILSEAYKNNLYVNMGLYISRERDGFDYNDEGKVAAQLEACRKLVRRFRNHPAVMCWSIGNEAESMYTNTKLWTAINDIAKMIHEEDPNHPVTTTLASSNVANVKLIVEMAPELDFLCINSYYPNPMNIQANLASAGWSKPWMITEFGQQGTWTTSIPKTSFGTLIEETSTQKAQRYKEIYEKAVIPNLDKGCLGSFPFVWGYQNHGEVLTWYGLFDKAGNTFGAVDEIQKYWTGKYPEKLAPVIADRNAMLLNGKIADESIILSPSSENTASVSASSPWGSTLSYQWLIYQEGTADADGSLPDGISGLIEDETLQAINFKAPKAVGNYRLLVFVRDTNRKVALSVIPFCVK